MKNYRPFDAISAYKGNVIMIHGDNDITVPCSVSENTFANLTTNNKKMVIISSANHGFGLWNNHMEQSKELTDETINYFKENL
jgi:Prolyl oligopeptidase family.